MSGGRGGRRRSAENNWNSQRLLKRGSRNRCWFNSSVWQMDGETLSKTGKVIRVCEGKGGSYLRNKRDVGKRQQVEERVQSKKTAREAQLQKMTENAWAYCCFKCKLEDSLIALTTTKDARKKQRRRMSEDSILQGSFKIHKNRSSLSPLHGGLDRVITIHHLCNTFFWQYTCTYKPLML